MWSRAALVTGPPLEQRTNVTSVVSRIGIASTSSGSSVVASVVPATFQLDESANDASAKPSTWLPESPMKTAAAAAGPQVEAAGSRGRRRRAQSARTSTARFGCSVAASIAKYGAGDRRERRRQAVHVVEQVERVRDPDEPDERERDREHVVADHLDRKPAADHHRRGAELRRELRERRQVVDVVERGPATKRSAQPPRMPQQLAARRGPRRRRRERRSPGHEAGEDADAAEDRGRPVVPALAGRDRRRGARRRAERSRPRGREPRRGSAAIAMASALTGGRVERPVRAAVSGRRPASDYCPRP